MKGFFVPIDLMIELEKKGFAEDCICGYNKGGRLVSKIAMSSGKDCSCVWGRYDDSELRAATWMQIIDYLRIKYKIHIAASSFPIYKDKYGYQCSRSNISDGWSPHFEGTTYYDALIKAIEEALKLI